MGRKLRIAQPAAQLAAAALLTLAVAAGADTPDWIAALGGTVERDAAGKVTAIDLTSTWVADEDLAKIAAFPEVRKLTLSYARISDLGFEHLRPLTKVTHLDCYYCEYVSDGAIAFLKQWKELEYLNLRGTEVTSRVFEHIAGMKKLKFLDVGFSRVNDDGFESLASLEQLSELHIGGDKMTGLALPLLRLLPSLRHLDLNGSQRTDSGRWGMMLSDANIDLLSPLVQLESLDIGGAPVTDAAVRALTPLVNLRALNLSRSDLTAAGLELLVGLPKLKRLNLWLSPRIDDKAVRHLVAMKTVEWLNLADTSITDASLDQLAAARSLKVLIVAGSKVTPEGVEKLRKARPDCRVIWAPQYKQVQSEEDVRLIG